MSPANLLEHLLANADRIGLLDLSAAMFLAGLIEVIFPPFPGDASLLVGGFIAGHRGFFLAWPLCAAYAGTFTAAAVLYILGRVWGRPLLHGRFVSRLLSRGDYDRIENWFGRYGLWVVLGSRFIPVVRSGIALAAGLSGLPPLKALGGLALGIIVFNSILVTAGSLVGENWRSFSSVFAAFMWSVTVAVAGIILFKLVRSRRRDG